MTGSALLEFAASRIANGQAQLAHHIKFQLSRSGHPAAAGLNYADDEVFLDPSLFAFCSDPDPTRTLDEILQRPRASQMIDGTGIGYSNTVDPLFVRLCEKAGGQAIEDSRDYEMEIASALKHIRRISAKLYRCIVAVTRQITTFSDPGSESFATLEAHGAVFLRTPPGIDEVFFIEDLAHQCGHLIFNAATIDPSQLITIDPQTPLADFTEDEDEARSLYVTLHGLFTESLMSIVLHGALELAMFTDRQRHEIRGRLSLIMRRFQLDLQSTRPLDVFTPEGRGLMTAFATVFDEVFSAARDEIVCCDLRNQPYAFSYDRFAELNPARAFSQS